MMENEPNSRKLKYLIISLTDADNNLADSTKKRAEALDNLRGYISATFGDQYKNMEMASSSVLIGLAKIKLAECILENK